MTGGGPTLQALIAKTEKRITALSDEELGGIVDDLLRRSADYKDQVLARPWMRSLAFFLGFQHIMWSSRTRRFFPMPLQGENRHTANLYRSHVMTMVSTFTAHRPKFSVIPEEASSQSRADARPAELILANLWNESRFTTRNIIGAIHRALFGGVWWEALYDEDSGAVQKEQQFAKDINGAKLLDADGKPIPLVDGRKNEIYEWTNPIGEVRAEIRSLFEAYWPPSAQEPISDELPWLIIRRPVPCVELKAKYGLTVKPNPEAVDPLHAMQMGLGADTGRYLDPQRLVDALWNWEGEESAWETALHAPHFNLHGFEGGLRLTVVDGKVVSRKEGALDNGALPFEFQPTIPVPLRLAGDTAAFDMQDPQMQYNWALADVAEMRRASAYPYVIYPGGSLNPADVSSGKRWIERMANAMDQSQVQIIETGRVSAATIGELNAHRGNIDSTASQFGSSRGELAGKSPQPVGTMQLMQTADKSDLQPGMDIADEAQGKLGGKLLTLVRMHYSHERLALVTSDEAGDVQGFMYSRSSLPKRFRVVIRPKSSINDTNKDALRTQFSEMAKSGVFGGMVQDPKMQEYMLELIDGPAPESFLTMGNLGYRRQEREIEEMLATMQPSPLGPFDDDKVHLAVIARLTNTGRWDVIGPQAQAVIMAHAQMHQQHQAMLEAQAMQAQMQAMAGGQPGQPAGAPPGLPM